METVELLKIQELIEKLELKIESLFSTHPKKEMSLSSDEVADLSGALAKAQAEFIDIPLSKTNPYYSNMFQDIYSFIKATRPALTKHGLSVTQHIISDDSGSIMLYTILRHSTGQWIKSTMRVVPPKNDVQTIHSHTTSLKRLAYGSLVGIVMENEDDDGEMAIATTRELRAKGTALNMKYNPRENNTEVISKDYLDELERELSDYPDLAEEVLDGLKIQSLADMPKSKFVASIERIRKIKNRRNGTNQ